MAELGPAGGAAGPEARERAVAAVTDRLEESARARHGAGVIVELVPLYDGARWSAYTFRRFDDLRLVAAVELQAGSFGGDADNFTYPRYALDFAFLRVYQDGRPLETEHALEWGREGADAGDVVFVVGNPGTTSRLLTVATGRSCSWATPSPRPSWCGGPSPRPSSWRHAAQGLRPLASSRSPAR